MTNSSERYDTELLSYERIVQRGQVWGFITRNNLVSLSLLIISHFSGNLLAGSIELTDLYWYACFIDTNTYLISNQLSMSAAVYQTNQLHIKTNAVDNLWKINNLQNFELFLFNPIFDHIQFPLISLSSSHTMIKNESEF